MRPLTIDLTRLAQALDSRDATEHYLDLDTGEVLAIAPGTPAPGREEKYQVQPGRYLPIEPLELSQALTMREAFLFTQQHPHAHAVLANALNTRRPLRTFDYELEQFPGLRAAWQTYQATQLRECAYAWLHDNGLEPSAR